MTALCRRFGISRKTGYKWLERYAMEGQPGLADRSRRPHRSPARTPPSLEQLVCAVRREHPAWGGRKIHHRLKGTGLGPVPAASTITGILGRNELLAPDRRLKRDWQRFEEDAPNRLWQMDFKGHFPTAGGHCHPFTALDDHSRFNIALVACPNERALTVQHWLLQAFEQYGLPERMLMDNGSPWGSERAHPHTRLTAWLMRLGITVSHGKPYHPQTQGKEERFHRTLLEEVLRPGGPWQSLVEVQGAFNVWRRVYNYERPHEAIDNQPPAQRYQPSARPLPAILLPIEYQRGDEVRRVQDKGRISFRGREFLVSRAFVGEPVALRPGGDGIWDVYYCHQRVARVDLSAPAAAGADL